MPDDDFYNPPDDLRKLLQGFTQQGYSLELALADLIDNSIDAEASQVLVRLEYDDAGIQQVVVADNGNGMTTRELEVAMKFATASDEKRTLSKFGLGMKVASLSQAPSFSVVSRKGGRSSGLSWSVQGVTSGWASQRVPRAQRQKLLPTRLGPVALKPHGTVVVWHNPHHLAAGGRDVEVLLNRTMDGVRDHLSLVFHRILRNKQLKLLLDMREVGARDHSAAERVSAVNPFGYRGCGAEGAPFRFIVDYAGRQITVVGHIWPPRVLNADQHAESGWNSKGGPVGAQGLYLYRNERLITHGGWGKALLHSTEHPPQHEGHRLFVLARAEIHLTAADDSAFGLSVNKGSAEPPDAFIQALISAQSPEGVSWREYLERARKAYRKAKATRRAPIPRVVGGALTKRDIRALKKAVAPKARETKEITIEWGSTGRMKPITIDREQQRIILSQPFRSAFLNGRNSSKGDLPVVKALLFLLLRDDLSHGKDSANRRRKREELNRVLRALLDRRRK